MWWISIVFWLVTHLPQIIDLFNATDFLDLLKKFLQLIISLPKAEAEALKAKLQGLKDANDVVGAAKLVVQTCQDKGIPGCPLELKD